LMLGDKAANEHGWKEQAGGIDAEFLAEHGYK